MIWNILFSRRNPHLPFWALSNLLLSKYTFTTAACGTDIPAGIAADTFAEFLLEECKFFFRAHCLDFLYLCKTVCILCILGFSDDLLVKDLVLFAFAGMASFQHGIFVWQRSSLAIDCLHGKRLLHSSVISAPEMLLDSLDSLALDFSRCPAFLYSQRR